MKLVKLVDTLEPQQFLISLLHFRVIRKSDEYQEVLIFITLPLALAHEYEETLMIFYYLSIVSTHNGRIFIQNDES